MEEKHHLNVTTVDWEIWQERNHREVESGNKSLKPLRQHLQPLLLLTATPSLDHQTSFETDTQTPPAYVVTWPHSKIVVSSRVCIAQHLECGADIHEHIVCVLLFFLCLVHEAVRVKVSA